ncbi:MAG: GIY-YIG nuclease family protein [bacterium]|nr:GIY-YIG nuclease family protein [bacterium]
MERAPCVYILTNPGHSVLYVGVSSALPQRVQQHKEGVVEGFTKKYHLDKLVYFEATDTMIEAIHREKELKGWSREKKEALIATTNPKWEDLSYRI